jgi:cellulose biosynthesis protein BcsQ
LNVLVVTGVEELERELQQVESHEMYLSLEDQFQYLLSSLEYIEDFINKHRIDVAIVNRYLDQTDDGAVLVDLFTRLKRSRPSFRLILILSDYDERVVYPLVSAGIYDLIIDKDISKSMILEAIETPARNFDFSKYQVREDEGKRISLTIPSFISKEKWKSKKVVSTYSPYSKGASEIAIALARKLSKKSDKVCLVDFDCLRPSIKEKLSLKGNQGLMEAIELARHNNLSSKNILGLLDKKEGYSVLSGLYDLNEINYLKKSYFERIIEVLKSSFEFIIIDLHSFHDQIANFVAFEKSDVIYTVMSGDKQNIEGTMRYINMFDAYEDVCEGVMEVVINGYSGQNLTSIEIENMIPKKVHYLPKLETGIFKKGVKKNYDKSLETIIKGL